MEANHKIKIEHETKFHENGEAQRKEYEEAKSLFNEQPAQLPAVGHYAKSVPFGSCKWLILDVHDNKALIITDDIIEQRQYDDQLLPGVTWKNCSLRKYLNAEFLQKFTAVQQSLIIETENKNPDNLWSGSQGCLNTVDKVFLLNIEEADRYFGNSGDYQKEKRKDYYGYDEFGDCYEGRFSNSHDSDRVAAFNGGAWWWWLRSPGERSGRCAACVYDDGNVNVDGDYMCSIFGGLRPALWLKLT